MFEGKVTMAEIGPRLKLIRQNMGITQRELARELGINQAIL
jgi:transcriptional regulator with XRE-family HTH domain